MVTTELEPIQVIATEQSRLAQEFKNLPSSAWQAPSRCAGWSNAVVVAHLAFYARAYTDSIARALRGEGGTPDGPEGRQVSREEYLSWERDTNNALAKQAPDGPLNEFITSGDKLLDTLTRVAPTDLDLPAWHQSGTYTVGTLMYWRIYELGFHGWDVRAALDPAAVIRPELCPYVLGTLRQLQPWLATPDTTIDATCRFEVDGQSWMAHIGDGKLAEISEPGEIDAVIRTDACTYLLLATLRQTLADCADRIAIEGSPERAGRVLSASGIRI